MNAASPQRCYALDCISMQARDVNRVQRGQGLTEVSVQSASQVRRFTNALVEKPDYQLAGDIQFTCQATRYVAAVAAASKDPVKHLQVFGREIGGVDRGRHVVLLSVRAKLTASISSARSMAAENFNLRSIMDDSK
ncbi:hypothetical protein ASE04_03975 [Rhizobium sp. Root708]|nr:hypothetical protein ASE04_03975 [Rhizobium sp. Root708]